jgi:predicted amino acid-binding ACT domain protein
MLVAVAVVAQLAVFVHKGTEQLRILAQVEITFPLIKVYMAVVEQEIMQALATMAFLVLAAVAVADLTLALEVLAAQVEVEL